MYFESFDALVSMDGHGAYVWAAYGIGLLVLGWNLVAPILNSRKVAADVRRRIYREQLQRQQSSQGEQA